MIAASTIGRAAWLAWRRQGIGASDAAAIANVDPYRGPMTVWLDKTGRLGEDDEDPEYRQWGNLLEPAIADQFMTRTGLYLPARALMVEHPTLPWMRATVDAVVSEVEPGDIEPGQLVPGATLAGVLEIKTVAGFKGRDWADGEVPEHFQLQVQHQLAVTGLEHAWLAVLFGGQHMDIRELDRDDDLIASLIDLEESFWNRHVLGDLPPASDGMESTTAALRSAYADAGGPSVDLPAEVEALFEQRAIAKEAGKAADKSCAEAEQALMALLGDAEVGLLGGQPRVTWKRYERASVDLDALRAKHPDVAAQLTVKSGYRVLRLVGAKEESS